MAQFVVLCLGFASIVPVFAAEPDLGGSLSLDACECQRGPDGLCRRWRLSDLSWQLYAPAGPTQDISNEDLERALVEAFVSWQGQTCTVCPAYGTLPDLPKAITDTALARPYGVNGCIPVRCDTNPLGLNFSYGGRSTVPLLSSDCPGANPVGCAGAAESSNQVAFLRDDTHWHFGQYSVTTTYLTSAHDGHIIDADILLRNTTRVFCYGTCGVAQWDVRAALVLELGNALGLGTAVALAGNPTPEATPAGEAPHLPTYVPKQLANCACLAYRYSTNPDVCLPPDTGFNCDAGPQRPLPDSPSRAWWWLVAIVPAAVSVWRYRKGRSSSVP